MPATWRILLALGVLVFGVTFLACPRAQAADFSASQGMWEPRRLPVDAETDSDAPAYRVGQTNPANPGSRLPSLPPKELPWVNSQTKTPAPATAPAPATEKPATNAAQSKKPSSTTGTASKPKSAATSAPAPLPPATDKPVAQASQAKKPANDPAKAAKPKTSPAPATAPVPPAGARPSVATPAPAPLPSTAPPAAAAPYPDPAYDRPASLGCESCRGGCSVYSQACSPCTSCVEPAGMAEASCGPRTDGTACDAGIAEDGGLPQPCLLQRLGVRLGGWLDQGVSASGRDSPDHYNGVVTFDDRNREYQMNQLYLFLERKVNTNGCGLDWGGRIDLLYGTDARFTQAAGLEDNWNQTERFYQLSAPQFFLDVGLDDWTLRMGHFYTILGYEVVTSPDNFFYSHSYSMQYGEPFTHTGMLLMRKLNDHWSISGGLTRGIDQFEDTDGADCLNFLGGATWTSDEERMSLAFAITAGEQGPDNTTWIYSTVAKLKLTERLGYVLQHDFGQTSTTTTAQWYSLLNDLTYTINPCWSAGLRYEWFADPDGVRVSGLGDRSPSTVNDNPHVGPYRGDFQEITVGLNWKPAANLVFRPELRWDWFSGTTEAGSQRPFAGDRNSQFMAACDMILTW